MSRCASCRCRAPASGGSVAQPVVQVVRAEVERAVQALAFALAAAPGRRRSPCRRRSRCISVDVVDHLAPDDAGLDAGGVKPSLTISLEPYRPCANGAVPPCARTSGVARQRRVERVEHAQVGGVVGVAQHQRVAQRVGQRADADLQRAAVAHQRAGVEADRVVGVADRLAAAARTACGAGPGRSTTRSKKSRVHRRAAAEPGQLRIDLARPATGAAGRARAISSSRSKVRSGLQLRLRRVPSADRARPSARAR